VHRKEIFVPDLVAVAGMTVFLLLSSEALLRPWPGSPMPQGGLPSRH